MRQEPPSTTGAPESRGARWRGRSRAGVWLTALSIVVGVGLLLAVPIGATVLGSSESGPTITSDLPDYNPGQTVTLTGSGWDTGGTQVHIVVNDAVGQTWQHTADVTPDSDGNVTDVFQLPSTFVAQYSVDATQQTSSGTLSASSSFTDANPSADLDQCANDADPSPNTDGCNVSANPSPWVNGNVNGSKANYFEGDSLPYRMRFDNLSLASHTVTIKWDTTKSSKHALDYLTTYDRTVTTANPCLDVSGCSLSPAPTLGGATNSLFAIPKDSQVDDGSGSPITQVPGNFTLYGGTITGVSGYSYPDGAGFTGDKSAQITITFTAKVGNPVLAWAGHIADRHDWGEGNAAVNVTGSPYHTSLVALDGSGGSQDRSLSADAVTFPGSITIVKDAQPEGSTSFPFTANPSPLSGFSLVDDGTSANTKVFSDIKNFQTYTVQETPIPTGWSLTKIVCSVTSPNGGGSTTNVGTATASINMKEGENYTCTYTNVLQKVTLTVIKHVINDNGGTKTAGDFTMGVTGGNASPSSFAGAESPGTSVSIDANTAYSVSEGSVAGYTQTDASAGCSSTTGIPPGGSATCTITNDDNAPSLTLNKIVVNDNGGQRAESEWTLTANGGAAGTLSGAGAAGNDDVVSGSGFKAGTYSLSESGPTDYTAGSWKCSKNGGAYADATSITLGLGDSGVCKITNDDKPGTIVIIKNAKPAQGTFTFTTTGSSSGPGTSWPSQFTLTGSTASDGNKKSFTVDAGAYTVTEGMQLSWLLTGIGGSTDPLTPYDCVVSGTGGSTGTAEPGRLTDRKVTINLKNGDTVTCTFENTGNGATRTQGFWATHPQLADIAWDGGTAFGHTFPGVAGVSGIGDKTLCGDLLTINADKTTATPGNSEVMGGFWSDVSKLTGGAKRSALSQAKMQLLQQLLAAELNASAFGSVPGTGSFTAWETAFCTGNSNTIKTAQQQAASFNSQGDSSTFTPGTSADSKFARLIANLVFWNKYS